MRKHKTGSKTDPKTQTTTKFELKNHELSISNILALSLRLLSNNYKLLLPIFLIIYLPLDIIPLFFPQLDSFQAYKTAQLNSSSISYGYTAYGIIKGLLGMLATIAVIYAVNSIRAHRKITLKQCFLAAKERWLDLLLTSLLSAVILLGLTLLLIVPGIIYYIYYLFFSVIVVLKDLKYKEALDYSKNLVKGRWWKIFGFFLVLFALSFVIGISISTLISFTKYSTVLGAAGNLILDLYALFAVICVTVYFINLDSLPHRKSES